MLKIRGEGGGAVGESRIEAFSGGTIFFKDFLAPTFKKYILHCIE